jgi:MFS family permease
MQNRPVLGIRENLQQFSLLVLVNAMVGAMIGLERSILPTIAVEEFHLLAKSSILSFIIVFGLSKAFTNYFAGRFSDRFGRKVVLIAGWLVTLPVPFFLMWGPTWNWILFANVLLGIGQGLTWSTTVIMKIDLSGPTKRGLAMGLNEFAGYFAVAGSALLTGYIAKNFGLRPEPFYLGIFYCAFGLILSVLFVKDTSTFVQLEGSIHFKKLQSVLSSKDIFIKTSFSDRNLSAITQAGFVNNLNDGMAWGLFPIFFAAKGMSLENSAMLASIYLATWGLLQLWTGHLSDQWGRKWFISWGMWVQAIGMAITVLSNEFAHFALGSFLLGVGTAMVYPTLLAAIGDGTHPSWRASAVGIYRFWRDSGYAAGAIIAGIVGDYFGLSSSIWLVALITAFSGLVVAWRMKEELELIANYQDCIKPELVRLRSSEEKVIIVDVRSELEFQRGHLEGAINIPIHKIHKSENEKIPKEALIVTVCNKGGGRSETAAKYLKVNGWQKVYWLCGGYAGNVEVQLCNGIKVMVKK